MSPWWSLCTLYLSHARWSYRRRLGSLLRACVQCVNCSSAITSHCLLALKLKRPTIPACPSFMCTREIPKRLFIRNLSVCLLLMCVFFCPDWCCYQTFVSELTSAMFKLAGSPEMTLCGWRCFKPSVNQSWWWIKHGAIEICLLVITLHVQSTFQLLILLMCMQLLTN